MRDKRFVRSTNYERLMEFLEERREERQRLGPEEVQDWSLAGRGGLRRTEEVQDWSLAGRPGHSLIPRARRRQREGVTVGNITLRIGAFLIFFLMNGK